MIDRAGGPICHFPVSNLLWNIHNHSDVTIASVTDARMARVDIHSVFKSIQCNCWINPLSVSIYLCPLTLNSEAGVHNHNGYMAQKKKWMTRRNFDIGSEIRYDLCLLRICQSKLAILTQKQGFLLIHFMRNVRGHKNKRWNFLKLFREDILVLLKFKITPLSFQTLAFHVICSREVYC